MNAKTDPQPAPPADRADMVRLLRVHLTVAKGLAQDGFTRDLVRQTTDVLEREEQLLAKLHPRCACSHHHPPGRCLRHDCDCVAFRAAAPLGAVRQ